MATMFGTQLARVVLGEEPEMPVEEMDQVPNHAFRQFGITWYMVSGRILDKRDMAETPPTLA